MPHPLNAKIGSKSIAKNQIPQEKNEIERDSKVALPSKKLDISKQEHETLLKPKEDDEVSRLSRNSGSRQNFRRPSNRRPMGILEMVRQNQFEKMESDMKVVNKLQAKPSRIFNATQPTVYNKSDVFYYLFCCKISDRNPKSFYSRYQQFKHDLNEFDNQRDLITVLRAIRNVQIKIRGIEDKLQNESAAIKNTSNEHQTAPSSNQNEGKPGSSQSAIESRFKVNDLKPQLALNANNGYGSKNASQINDESESINDVSQDGHSQLKKSKAADSESEEEEKALPLKPLSRLNNSSMEINNLI